MRVFRLGLLLGGLSGGATYLYTGALGVSAIVGAVAAALTWFGLGTVIVCDD